MLLTVLREYGAHNTPGILLINGNFFCYTLELKKGECIAERDYHLHLTYSPRFKRIMPQIMDVAGKEGVRIHWGNFAPKDTEGCLLVGQEAGLDGDGRPAVFKSRVCFTELFSLLEDANKGQVLAIEFKEKPKCLNTL